MSVKLLTQNLEYFKYSNNIIKSVEIDNRFNDIVNYLNDEIIYRINNLNDNIILGSLLQNDINSILKSNDENGYRWKKINNADFIDYSIDIRKFNYKNITNSIFINSTKNDVMQIQNSDMNNFTIVYSSKLQKITFDKLSNEFIDPVTKITGDKIAYGSISVYNLLNIEPLLLENSVISDYIKDRAITTSKIADNSLNLRIFDSDSRRLLNYYIWNKIIPENFINLNSVGNINNIISKWDRTFLKNYAFDSELPIGINIKKPYTIPISKFTNFYVKNIIKYYVNGVGVTDLSLTDPAGKKVGAEKIYVLSSHLFKSNSINSNRLFCWAHKVNDADKCYNINDILSKNTITIEHLTPAIRQKLGYI